MIVSQATLKRRKAQYSGVGGYLKVGEVIGDGSCKARRPQPEARRAESGGGVLGEGAASPSPLDRGPGER